MKAACHGDVSCNINFYNESIKEHNEKYKNNPFDDISAPEREKTIQHEQQNIRNPSSAEVTLKLGEFVEAIISSKGVDIKGIVKSGGIEMKRNLDGKVEIKYGNGSFLDTDNLGGVGAGLKMFQAFEIKTKMNDAGMLEWGAKAKLFNGKVALGIKGTTPFDPVGNGKKAPIGRALLKHFNEASKL